MIDRRERLLVLGAGPVGLAVAKAFRAHEVPYDHVEADDDVGGNWYHGVYESAHIISSKRTTEYPDFPMPDDYPDFPSARQMFEYYRSYTAHHRLRERLELETRVERIDPSGDGAWRVELSTGETRAYKGVVVCNGHHWHRRFPKRPGVFHPEMIHSKDYRSAEQLTGRRVLVIGGGNSACDIASEAARVGTSCDLSVRRGYWFLPKTLLGKPTVELVKPWVPVWLQRLALRLLLRLAVGDYRRYGLPAPEHRLFETHPTVSTEMLHYVKHGRIRPRPDVEAWDGDGVRFVDGTRSEYDLVVCATGFEVRFPFLPDGLVEIRGTTPQVYAGSLVPDAPHLYLVGTLQPRYGVGPLITPYAELLVELVRAQDRIDAPLGTVLRRLGAKPPKSPLVDPHAALREMRRGRRMVRWLPAVARFA